MLLDSYKKKIRNLAEKRTNEMFFNTDAKHATIVLTELIKNAEDYVYIVGENMDPTVTDDEEYLDAVENFLKKENAKMKILLTDYNKKEFDNSKIGKLLSRYKNVVEIKDSQKELVKSDGVTINFTVSDGRAFRFERDVKNRIAFGNFNDTETAISLEKSFENIFANEHCKVVA